MPPSPTERTPDAGSSGRSRGRSLLAAALAAPAVLLVALTLAGPIASGDLWWHLSTGNLVLEQGGLPEKDPLGFSAPDEPWTLHEWGEQVLVALLERAGGETALRVTGTLLALALVLCAWRAARRRLPPAWAAAATALFATLFALKWELRPQLLSALFVLALDATVFRAGRPAPGRREWIGGFLLGALWTQLHGEAMFASIFVAAGAIGAVLRAVLERGGARCVGRWLALFVAVTAGTMLSPEGFDQHLYALSGSSVPRDFIEEWAPQWVLPGDPRFAPVTVALFAVVVAATLAGGAFVVGQALRRLAGRRDGTSWERIGFLAVCVLMAVLARRFFWLAWFPAVDLLAAFVAARPRAGRARVVPALAALGLAWVLLGTHFPATALASLKSGRYAQAVDAGLFPVHAADFLAESGIEGNLFHRYEWGGYLGWRLWPACRVVADGRTVLFARVIPERWRVERWRSAGDREHAERKLAEWDVRAIVMPNLVDHGRGPVSWRPPGAHETWIRAWAGATAVVWIRADDAEAVERATAWYAAHGIALDPARGAVEAQVLRAHPEWLREKEVLAPAVRARLAPLIEGGTGALELAAAFRAVGMRRSARFELERHVRKLFADDEAACATWLARIDGGDLDELFASVPRARGARTP